MAEPCTPTGYDNSRACQSTTHNNLCCKIRPTTESTDKGMLRCNYHKSWAPSELPPLFAPHNTPDLHLPLKKKILARFFPSQYSHIVPLCPAILGLRCEQQSLNFQSFDDFYMVCLQRTFTMGLASPRKDSFVKTLARSTSCQGS